MRKILIVCTILFVGLWISSGCQKTPTEQQDEKAVRMQVYKGNKVYQEGEFEQAEGFYKEALAAQPSYAKASFNLGNAYYHQQKWEPALQAFYEVGNNKQENKNFRAAAFYNAGNVFLEQQKYPEAIEEYKKSLRLNPNNYNTKYNLAYAQKMTDNQDQNEDKNDDQSDEDDNDENSDDNKDQDQNKDDSDQDEQKDPAQDEQKDEDEQKQNPQENEQKLSQSQAEALLDAMNQQEKMIQERKNDEDKKHQIYTGDKDW